MQRELWVSYLRSCRWGEQIMFEQEVGDVMIRDFYLPEARVSVVLDPPQGRYRLIVISSCQPLSVCMERESFLPSLFNWQSSLSHHTQSLKTSFRASPPATAASQLTIQLGSSQLNRTGRQWCRDQQELISCFRHILTLSLSLSLRHNLLTMVSRLVNGLV